MKIDFSIHGTWLLMICVSILIESWFVGQLSKWRAILKLRFTIYIYTSHIIGLSPMHPSRGWLPKTGKPLLLWFYPQLYKQNRRKLEICTSAAQLAWKKALPDSIATHRSGSYAPEYLALHSKSLLISVVVWWSWMICFSGRHGCH